MDVIQRSFGTHDVSGVRAQVGGVAADASSQLGASAYALGDRVGFAGTPDLHTAAHEAAHVVQQRSGVATKSLDGGAGDPFEDHADRVADLVVAGGDAGPLLDDLAGPGAGSPVVQRRRKPDEAGPADEEAEGQPAPKLQLPGGKDYEVQNGQLVVTKAWMADSSSGLEPIGPDDEGVKAPKRLTFQLQQLRANGVFAWIDDDQIAAAAEELYFGGPYAKWPDPFAWRVEMSAFQVIGPPTGNEMQWMQWGDGMLAVAKTDVVKSGSKKRKGRFEPKKQLHARLVAALEGATGLRIPDERRANVSQYLFDFHIDDTGSLVVMVTREQCEDIFGKETWEAFLTGGYGVGDSATVVTSSVAFDPDVSPEDIAVAIDFMIEIEADLKDPDPSKPPPPKASPYLITVIKRINGLDPKMRERVIAKIKAAKVGTNSEPMTGFGLEKFVQETELDVGYEEMGVKKPAPSNRKGPVFDAAIRGRIVNVSGGIHADEKAEFGFEKLSPDHGDVFDPPKMALTWTTHKLDHWPDIAPDAPLDADPQMPSGAPRIHGPVTRSGSEGHVGNYGVTLEPGYYAVHAIVTHNYFHPAHFWIPIEVKYESQRIRELQNETFAGMGNTEWSIIPHDFATGKLDDSVIGSGQYHNGSIGRGQLPDDWVALTPKQRMRWLKDKKASIKALIKEYGDSSSPGHKDIADYARHYLETLNDTESRIKDERADGYRFFECRATYVSRKANYPDRALHLTPLAHVTDESATVKIHDHSQVSEPRDYHFARSAGTFEGALEATFVDLCKSYPPGSVSLLAETLDEEGKSTKQTLGFELDTGGTWKDIKETVWEPAVQIAVNVAGAVIMIFAPALAGGVMLALAAYNAVDTLDNLEDLKRKGIVTNTDKAIAYGQIALDLLPFVGRAKPLFKSATKTALLVDGVQIAGSAVILTVDAQRQLERIRDKDVAEIAKLNEWIQDPANQAHPDRQARQEQLDARILDARTRGIDMIEQMVIQGGIMLAPNLVFTKVSQQIMSGKLEDLLALGVVKPQKGVDKPFYDPNTGTMVVPENLDQLGYADIERLQAAYVADLGTRTQEIADLAGIDPKNVGIQPGEKLDVKFDGDRVDVTAPPGMTREEVLDEVWRKRQAKGGAPSQRPATTHAPITPHFDAGDIAAGKHIVVGNNFESRSDALDAMRKVAAGDPDGFAALGVRVGDDFDPAAVEWGVGLGPDGKYVVVKGAAGVVDWGALPGVTGHAHSHHFDPSRALKGGGISLSKILKGSGDWKTAVNRGLVLPSAADFGYCASHDLARHVVVTPYVYKGKGHIGDPVPGKDLPRVEFEIRRAEYVGDFEGDASQPVYKATVVVRSGDTVLETQTFYAMWHNSLGDVVEPGLIPHTPRKLGPAERAPAVTPAPHNPGDPDGPTPTDKYTWPDRQEFVKTHGTDVVQWAERGLAPNDTKALLALDKKTLAALDNASAADAKKALDLLGKSDLEDLVPPLTGANLHWAMASIDGGELKTFLKSVDSKTLAALSDITAAEAKHAIKIVGRKTLEKVAPPLSGSEIKREFELLGESTAAQYLKDNADKPSLIARLDRQAKSFKAAEPEIGKARALDPDSVILDTNAITALHEATSAKPWGEIDAGRIAAINRLREMNGQAPLTGEPPARDLESLIGPHDVRITNMVFGEQGATPDVKRAGVKISVTRDSPVYDDMTKELETIGVGDPRGAADRSIIADTLFAEGAHARFVTGDEKIVVPLARRFASGTYEPIKVTDSKTGRKRKESDLEAIVRVHGESGFEIAITDSAGNDRKMTLFPFAEEP